MTNKPFHLTLPDLALPRSRNRKRALLAQVYKLILSPAWQQGPDEPAQCGNDARYE